MNSFLIRGIRRSLHTAVACTLCVATAASAQFTINTQTTTTSSTGTTTTTLSQFTIPTPSLTGLSVLPTDVSSWGGERGFVRGRQHMEGAPDLSAWLFHGQEKNVERDSRYSFTGNWSYFDDIDKFVAKLQDKMPALAKVTAELKTPCGKIPATMPPVPELPKPEALAQHAKPPVLNHPWLMVLPSGTASPHSHHQFVFSHTLQCFASGASADTRRYVIGSPGTTVTARSDDDVVMKVGRAYFLNLDPSATMEIESGRIRVMLPPGCSGIVDTATNGLTQFSALLERGDKPIRVVDLCNTTVELAKPATGQFVTIAPEDSVAEDLMTVHGVEQNVETIDRNEGYLLVKGNFSVEDACRRGALFQSLAFQTVPTLSEQKTQLLSVAQTHPFKREGNVITTGLQTTGAVPVAANPAELHRGPSFMPTRGARYGRLSGNEILVADGAVLVKGAEKPVLVSADVNREKVMTEVRPGAVVMVSAFDGRLTVLNLTDGGPGSCAVYIPPRAGAPYKRLNVGMGQVAEVYINDGMEPASTVLSYRILDKRKLSDTLGMVISQYDYLAAMKRFNLSFALPQPDLNKVLKTMAATAWVMKSWTSSK